MRTDHEIRARRPDLVIINKRDKSCQIIDVVLNFTVLNFTNL